MSCPRDGRVSPAQVGLWFAQQLDPADAGFMTAEFVELRGVLDRAAFASATAVALGEADGFGSVFEQGPGSVDGPVRRVRPLDAPLRVVDLSDAADPWAAALDWMERDRALPVDLAAGGLVGQALIVLGPGHHLWFLRVHHILADGYAYTLVARRTADVYSDLTGGAAVRPSPLRPVAELLDEQEAYRASATFAADREYWAGRLAGFPEPVGLSTRSGSAPGFLRATGDLDPARHARVAAVLKESKHTLAELYVAAAALYVQRRAGADDVVLGLPMMGRLGSVAARVPATTVNVLPLWLAPTPRTTVAQLLAAVRAELVATGRHQRYRGEDIRRDLGLVGGDRRFLGPWVNVKPYAATPRFGTLSARTHYLAAGPVEDLSITVTGGVGATPPLVEVDGNPARYTRAELAGHRAGLLHVLDALVAAGAQAPLGRIALPAAAVPADRTDVPVPETGLAAMVAEQARRTPDRVAVRAADGELRYRELDEQAARLATRLRAHGAVPETIVAVALPRTTTLLVALLAVARTGAAYLPLDAGFPADRLRSMVADAAPVVLVTDPSTAHVPGDVPRLVLDGPLDGPPAPVVPVPGQALAYVLFTSGSTGRPKGVAVSSRNLVNFLRDMVGRCALGPGDVLLAVTTVGFDISALELYVPLLSGACVHVADTDTVRDPRALAELVARSGATLVQATPSLWQALLPAAGERTFAGVRVLVGGEALPATLATQLLAAAPAVTNVYGPTETTIWSTAHVLDAAVAPPPPIGRPLANTQVHVLDAALHPVPAGVPGELYIAGDGLARGYLGRPELTAERFVANPFGPGRLYRTGDLARRRDDGELEVLGRLDHQVKIRGFRVELDEISDALLRLPGVTRAVAVADGAGATARLVGYVECAAGALPVDPRAELARVLPDYMVPALVTALPALPLTANGKIDRRALPAPAPGPTPGGRAPRTAREETLARLVATVLGVPEVGLDDDVFALGGQSLLAARLAAAVRAELGVELSIRSIFEAPTVAGMVDRLGAAAAVPPVRPTTGPVPLSGAQRGLWAVERMRPTGATYHIPLRVDLVGALDRDALAAALRDVVARHEPLRTVLPDGEPTVLDVPDHALDVVEVEAEAGAQGVDQLVAAEIRRPFDLATAPPLRATLFESGDRHRTLLLVLHHIAGDEWSLRPLLRDLDVAYRAPRGRGAGLGAAAGELRRLRPLAAGPAARRPRRRRGGVLDRRAGRRTAGAGAAHRPAAARGALAPRRHGGVVVAGPAHPGRAGARRRERRQPVHGAARRVGRAAHPAGCGHRHPDRSAHLGPPRPGARRPGGLLRVHGGAAHRHLRRPHVPAAAAPGPGHRPAGAGPSAAAVRPGGRRRRAAPLTGPQPAVPGDARLPRGDVARRRVRPARGDGAVAGHRHREGGPHVQHRRRRAAGRLRRVRHRPVRRGGGGRARGPPGAAAHRGHRRPRPADRRGRAADGRRAERRAGHPPSTTPRPRCAGGRPSRSWSPSRPPPPRRRPPSSRPSTPWTTPRWPRGSRGSPPRCGRPGCARSRWWRSRWSGPRRWWWRCSRCSGSGPPTCRWTATCRPSASRSCWPTPSRPRCSARPATRWPPSSSTTAGAPPPRSATTFRCPRSGTCPATAPRT